LNVTVSYPDAQPNNSTITQFELHALKDSDTFEVRDDDDDAMLVIEHFDTRFDPAQHRLHMRHGEVRVAGTFAEKMERPELAGLCIGVLDCEIEIQELEARIERRKVPPPYACGMPVAPNAALRIKEIEAVQQIGFSGDEIKIGAGLVLENPGPFVAASSALNNVHHTLALLAVSGIATTEVARAEQATRFVPANRSTCPDETKFIPGSIARHSLAGVILENSGLNVSAKALDSALRGEATLVLAVGNDSGTISIKLLPARTGDLWHFRLATP
jgi:hypothetical protein